MDAVDRERIVARRRSRYQRAIAVCALTCIVPLALFTCAMIFIPMHPKFTVFPRVLMTTFMFGGGSVGFWIMATLISVDVLTTNRQLSDLENDVRLAQWVGQGGGGDVYLGLCGLVYENAYVPWQGVWDFSLAAVSCPTPLSLKFVFARETRAGVRREKSIVVPVPEGRQSEAVAALDLLTEAVADKPESMDIWLRRRLAQADRSQGVRP